MKKDHEGVTTNKSNKVMNNAEFINKEMDTINKWLQTDRMKRIKIAQYGNFNNSVCPICGKEMDIRERSNGSPLVNANVCNKCDKRYVFTFRLLPISTELAPNFYLKYLDAELLIELTKRVKSIHTNHTDVA